MEHTARHALVPIADGSEEIEAVVIIDVLRRAGAEVTVASVDGLQVTASRGVKLVADMLIRECTGREYDLIALPGGKQGAEHLRDSPELLSLLKKQQAEGRLCAAICASPAVVLEHHGLIAGRRATCHPGFTGALSNREVISSRVVLDGNLVTSRGPGTAIEFALTLVELLFGKEKSREVADPMIVA